MEKTRLVVVANKAQDINPVSSSLNNLSIHSISTHKAAVPLTTTPSYRGGLPPQLKKKPPRKLVSLCLGVLGQYFEDIIEDLSDISSIFPADIKLALASIARRRKLLTDDVLIALVDNSWELLDISGSFITDTGLAEAARVCTNIKAADISRCNKITAMGVSDLMHHCRSLETLRCGGCPTSEYTVCRSLSIFKPTLKVVEEETWEELDSMEISSTCQSLRWLSWPKIDENSQQRMATDCPRIILNPQPSPPLSIRGGGKIPRAALPNIVLDEIAVEDIDPKTWVEKDTRSNARNITSASSASSLSPSPLPISDMPMAEKFRLAFVERDERLAPKRAKNARQHQRRAEREFFSTNANGKSIAFAKHFQNHW